EHPHVDMSRLDLGDDIGLKVRDQSGGVRIAPVGAVGQMLKQPLQKKLITDGKRLHRCCAEACGKPRLKCGEHFARRGFATLIQVVAKWAAGLADRNRDSPPIRVGWHGFWPPGSSSLPPRILLSQTGAASRSCQSW